MTERPTGELFFELRLVDDYGRVHGVIRRPIHRDAAYRGPRVKENLELGALIPGAVPFDAAVEVLQVKEFRRRLLLDAARNAGGQLADFLEDRTGKSASKRYRANIKERRLDIVAKGLTLATAECAKLRERIAELEAAIDKAHALLSCIAGQGVVKDGQQRMPVGVQAESGGVARYLTASFVKKCADWCEDFRKF